MTSLPVLANIEPIARAICEQNIARAYPDPVERAAAVERLWHCVAAELEGGDSIEAYRDWLARHPGYRPPAG